MAYGISALFLTQFQNFNSTELLHRLDLVVHHPCTGWLAFRYLVLERLVNALVLSLHVVLVPLGYASETLYLFFSRVHNDFLQLIMSV